MARVSRLVERTHGWINGLSGGRMERLECSEDWSDQRRLDCGLDRLAYVVRLEFG